MTKSKRGGKRRRHVPPKLDGPQAIVLRSWRKDGYTIKEIRRRFANYGISIGTGLVYRVINRQGAYK